MLWQSDREGGSSPGNVATGLGIFLVVLLANPAMPTGRHLMAAASCSPPYVRDWISGPWRYCLIWPPEHRRPFQARVSLRGAQLPQIPISEYQHLITRNYVYRLDPSVKP